VLHLLAGLTTGHKIGLAVVAAVFIVFALAASFLAPRRWPDFPGRNGLSVFVIASFVLFFAMLAAVLVFGKESEAAGEGEKAVPEGAPAKQTIVVHESEWKVQLPPLKELKEGQYTLHVINDGKIPHNLVVSGPKAAGDQKTTLIKPGGTDDIIVALGVGNYTLWCSVAGHKQLGMSAQISVG
jgi:uncharacterized cupredoxin-like copper-binding protein